MPKDCRLLQAVVRSEYDTGKITYLYDRAIMEILKKDAPLQYSFLMVHEWLRDFQSKSSVIRKINHFLHSDASQKMTDPKLFNAQLASLGVDLVELHSKQKNYCNRLPETIDQIRLQTDINSCSDFSDMNHFFSLNISDSRLTGLSYFEFSGFNALVSLNLSHNQLGQLYSMQFSGLRNLHELDISHNQLQQLPQGIFSSQSQIAMISLANNSLVDLPDTFWTGPTDNALHKLGVDLSHNQLAKIPDSFLNFAPKTHLTLEVNLSHNRLESLPTTIGINRMTYLDLSNNHLKSVPTDLCKVIKAKGALRPQPGILDLRNNLLTDAAKSALAAACKTYNHCRCLL